MHTEQLTLDIMSLGLHVRCKKKFDLDATTYMYQIQKSFNVPMLQFVASERNFNISCMHEG